MYSVASARSPFGFAEEVEIGALEAAGLIEPWEPGRDDVRGDGADELAAARVAQVGAVRGGDHGLADVDVVERRPGRVQRDVTVAAARGQRELVRVLRCGELQRGRVEREVAVYLRVSRENLLRRGVRVGEALLEVDRIEVRGAEVGARVPVRIADELDLLARGVAGELARAVVLDHVRARRDLVVAVRRGVLRVELGGVVTRNRRTNRQSQGPDEAELTGVRKRDLERLVVRTGDSGDVGRLRRLLLDRILSVRKADDVGEVQADVAVGNAGEQRPLDRVLEVVADDLAVDGRRELDARLKVVRDRLAVVRDRRLIGGDVGRGLRRVRRGPGQQLALRGRVDHVAELVVRRARVDVVDVTDREDAQVAALGRAVRCRGRRRELAVGGRPADRPSPSRCLHRRPTTIAESASTAITIAGIRSFSPILVPFPVAADCPTRRLNGGAAPLRPSASAIAGGLTHPRGRALPSEGLEASRNSGRAALGRCRLRHLRRRQSHRQHRAAIRQRSRR